MTDNEIYDDVLNESFEEDDFDFNEEGLDDPMSDDFDFDAGLEEDDFEGDDFGEEDGFDDFSDEAPKSKSKMGLNFNTIVIIGAVLVGGLVMVMQLNKSSEKQKVAVTKTENFATALKMEGAFDGPGKIKEEDLQSVNLNDSEGVNEDKGFLFDTESIEPDIQDVENKMLEGAPPMPSPIVSDETNIVLAEEDVAQAIPDVVKIEGNKELRGPLDQNPQEENMAQNVEDIFGKKDAFGTQDDTAVELKIAEEVEIVKQENNNLTNQIIKEKASLEKQEIEIKEIKEATNNVLNDVQEKLENDKNLELTPSSKDVNVLLSKLDIITARLDEMENKIADIQTSSSEKKLNKAVVSPAKKKTTPTAKVVKQPKKKTAVKKKASSSKVVWELRAAQPGKAWVSKRGHRDMQPVVVGDKLASIGRIHSIQYLDKKWIVSDSMEK